MYGLQLKSKEELIDIILRKDELEKKLREEIKSLKANGGGSGIAEVSDESNTKRKRLSKRKVWMIAIAFALVVVVTTQLVGFAALSICFDVDFPMSWEQHDAVRDMIRQNYWMLAFYLCVCLGVFFMEFIAIHFILHINPFKNNKSKQQ